jgi:hypothetical protein
VVAEEMLLWGWQGLIEDRQFLEHDVAKKLLQSVTPTSNMSPQSRANFLSHELESLSDLSSEFETIAESQSKRLVAAHERFSSLMDKQKYQVVYPVLPMDLLGIYVLLPEVSQ